MALAPAAAQPIHQTTENDIVSANAKLIAPDSQQAPEPPVRDEWGMFDPQQAGMEAAIRALQQQVAATIQRRNAATSTDTAVEPAPTPITTAAQCRFCAEPLPPDARECPTCEAARTASTPPAVADAADARGALYEVEFPVPCPHCRASLTAFRVFRLLRTQVSFTSTLPRKGYVIVCPECEQLLSAELSGMI